MPGALSCVTALAPRFKLEHPEDEGARRAALAHWLTDPRNPLTWRSIVNRVWQYHFGRGLVDTPNDFGRMGSLPTHPALLDWLAVDFRDHGQSLKRLHRLIVTSATYRQSSRIADIPAAQTAKAIAADVDNRFLWRMNRQRLDAECVRDTVLEVSGRLDLRMGGPSDRQFTLRPGVHVTPVVDYSKFNLDSEAGRRRSVYRFLFRTLPDPFMEAFDCPSGDELTPLRTSSITVQQALAMWNDAFIARHCEFLATRLQTLGARQRATGLPPRCNWCSAAPPAKTNSANSRPTRTSMVWPTCVWSCSTPTNSCSSIDTSRPPAISHLVIRHSFDIRHSALGIPHVRLPQRLLLLRAPPRLSAHPRRRLRRRGAGRACSAAVGALADIPRAGIQRRLASSGQGEADDPVVHERRSQPGRSVRLQTRTRAAAWPDVRSRRWVACRSGDQHAGQGAQAAVSTAAAWRMWPLGQRSVAAPGEMCRRAGVPHGDVEPHERAWLRPAI